MIPPVHIAAPTISTGERYNNADFRSPERPMRRWHLALLTLVMLTLTAVAAPLLTEAIWTDEQRTLWYAGAAPQYGPDALTTSITRVADNRWQAPAYFLTMWGWGRLVGWSVFAMRSFSLLSGMLAIAGMYATGRGLFNRDVGLYAAFALGMAAFFVNFLHDMRGYTLFICVGILAMWAYNRAAHYGERWAYPLLIAALALLPYTHYFMGFLFAGLGLSHLILRWNKPRFWIVLACFVAAGLLFLPWAQVFIAGAALSADAGQRVDNMTVIEATWGVLRMFANGSYALMLVLLFMAATRRDGLPNRLHLWIVLLTGLALALGSTRVFRILNEVRYLIFLWIPLSLVAGLGILELRRVRYGPSVVLAVWAVGFGYGQTNLDFQRDIYAWATPAFDEATPVLNTNASPEDAFVYLMPSHEHVVELDAVLDHYLWDTPLSSNRLVHDTFAMTENAYAGFVLTATRDAPRVWLGYDPSARPWRAGPTEQTTLPDAGYADCGAAYESQALTLKLFSRQPTDTTTFSDADAARASLVQLVPATLDRAALSVALGWSLLPDTPASYSVALHVTDADGVLVTQADYGIAPDGFGCAFNAFSASDWPTGAYTVSAFVYNWMTGERLEADTEGGRLLLGSIAVP
ncbi:MAG: glycosyltransferase family 39 protein [Chloroflexota bacterium]